LPVVKRAQLAGVALLVFVLAMPETLPNTELAALRGTLPIAEATSCSPPS